MDPDELFNYLFGVGSANAAESYIPPSTGYTPPTGPLLQPGMTQGAPIRTPEEEAAARASIGQSIRDLIPGTYPGRPEFGGPTGPGSIPAEPPAVPGTAPSLTAGTPPPPPPGMGGGPMAGAPASLFPWIATPGAGGTTANAPVPSGAPAAPAPAAAVAPKQKTPEEEQQDRILATLRGIQAPPAPVPQKVATPHPPAVHPAAQSHIVQTLISLGLGPKVLPQLGKL